MKTCSTRTRQIGQVVCLRPQQSDTSPITGAVLANTTLTPNRAVKKILEWLMLTCEEAGADAEELC